jgi:hypothetical protein
MIKLHGMKNINIVNIPVYVTLSEYAPALLIRIG